MGIKCFAMTTKIAVERRPLSKCCLSEQVPSGQCSQTTDVAFGTAGSENSIKWRCGGQFPSPAPLTSPPAGGIRKS